MSRHNNFEASFDSAVHGKQSLQEVIDQILRHYHDDIKTASQIIEKLITETDQNGQSSFHKACYNNKIDVLKELIALYENYSSKKETILHHLSIEDKRKMQPIHLAAERQSVDIIKYLIDTIGINVNTSSSNGNTILHYISGAGMCECSTESRWQALQEFLQYPCFDILNATNMVNRTPLHTIATSKECSAEFVKLLLEKGADPFLKDLFDSTAIHLILINACDSPQQKERYVRVILNHVKPNLTDDFKLQLYEFCVKHRTNVPSRILLDLRREVEPLLATKRASQQQVDSVFNLNPVETIPTNGSMLTNIVPYAKDITGNKRKEESSHWIINKVNTRRRIPTFTTVNHEIKQHITNLSQAFMALFTKHVLVSSSVPSDGNHTHSESIAVMGVENIVDSFYETVVALHRQLIAASSSAATTTTATTSSSSTEDYFKLDADSVAAAAEAASLTTSKQQQHSTIKIALTSILKEYISTHGECGSPLSMETIVQCFYDSLVEYYEMKSNNKKRGKQGTITTVRVKDGEKEVEVEVVSILGYRGDPKMRKSTSFLCQSMNGDSQWLDWSKELCKNVHYKTFCHSRPELVPLLYTTSNDANLVLAELRVSMITEVQPGDVVYIDLRSWDHTWYDVLTTLEDHFTTTYLVKHEYQAYRGNRGDGCDIDIFCPVFNVEYEVNYVFVKLYGCWTLDQWKRSGAKIVIVDEAFLETHPEIKRGKWDYKNIY